MAEPPYKLYTGELLARSGKTPCILNAFCKSGFLNKSWQRESAALRLRSVPIDCYALATRSLLCERGCRRGYVD